jgi:membrane-bound inhibitor of C-type lysozyme
MYAEERLYVVMELQRGREILTASLISSKPDDANADKLVHKLRKPVAAEQENSYYAHTRSILTVVSLLQRKISKNLCLHDLNSSPFVLLQKITASGKNCVQSHYGILIAN